MVERLMSTSVTSTRCFHLGQKVTTLQRCCNTHVHMAHWLLLPLVASLRCLSYTRLNNVSFTLNDPRVRRGSREEKKKGLKLFLFF